MCNFTDYKEAHAVICIFDSQTLKDRTNVYFIDPNGNNSRWTKPFVSQCRTFFNHWNGWLIRNGMSEYHSIHTYTLNTPSMNQGYTDYMEYRDKQENFRILDEWGGFCQPWTYVYLIDVMCTKQLFTTQNHFLRLYQRAGGTSNSSEERQYTRLMYLRQVLVWIWDNMTDAQLQYDRVTSNGLGNCLSKKRTSETLDRRNGRICVRLSGLGFESDRSRIISSKNP